MNYIKKLKNIGFKKCPEPLVVSENIYSQIITKDSDGNRLFGKTIIPINIFLKNLLTDLISSKHYDDGDDDVNNKIYNIGFTSGKIDELKKIQTYKWCINYDITIFISIHKNKYACFMENKSLVPSNLFTRNSKMLNSVIVVVVSAELTPYFWSEILSKLDTGYRREILLKEILS